MGLCAYRIETDIPADAKFQVGESNGWYYCMNTDVGDGDYPRTPAYDEIFGEEKYVTKDRQKMIEFCRTLNLFHAELRDHQFLVSKRIYQLKAAIAENQQALRELQEELQRKQAGWDNIDLALGGRAALEAHADYINQYAGESEFLVDVVGFDDEPRLRLRDTFMQSSVADVTSIRWGLREAVDKFRTNPYDAIRLAQENGWVIVARDGYTLCAGVDERSEQEELQRKQAEWDSIDLAGGTPE